MTYTHSYIHSLYEWLTPKHGCPWVILDQGHFHSLLKTMTTTQTNSTRAKGWCFTINNPTGWDDADIEKVKEVCEYIVIGKEKGEEGTPHYQGFVRFKHAQTFLRVKTLLQRAHIEKQKGTAAQAADYCKKEGDFEEFGEPPKSVSNNGQRTKQMWKNVITWAEDGEIQRIKDEYPHIFFLHFKRIEQLRTRSMGILSGDLSNEWWVGPTGTGKSRRLWELHPDHYSKSLNKWWDGYNNEDIVAMEEMDPDHGKYIGHFVKIWADRYPFSPETKGGHLKKIRPKKIIILSNYSIDECFPREQDRNPIKRRFQVIRFGDHEFNPTINTNTDFTFPTADLLFP